MGSSVITSGARGRHWHSSWPERGSSRDRRPETVRPPSGSRTFHRALNRGRIVTDALRGISQDAFGAATPGNDLRHRRFRISSDFPGSAAKFLNASRQPDGTWRVEFGD
jgi:hypothetical protein